jgi:L,D-peptidoglycan transpeptidase YkuD (ErfK/YbiS/YcfS/YnhG family)
MEVRVLAEGVLLWPGHRVACSLGRSGIRARKREGDGATPAGRFPLRGLRYRADRIHCPLTRVACQPIRPDDGWCDDPADALYNRPVRLPYPSRCERMWREDRLYDLVVIIGHNDDPVIPGGGSAIFLHVAGTAYPPTEGCVALALPDLARLVAALAPDDHIVIGDVQTREGSPLLSG